MTRTVVQVVLSLAPGGTERLVIDICRRLSGRFRFHVICLDDVGAWARELSALGIGVESLHRRPGFQVQLPLRIATIARRERADVLHCHHFSPFVYGRMSAWVSRGVRVVFTEHGRLAGAVVTAKRKMASRLLSCGVRDLYAVSHDLRSDMIASGYPARVGVVWNGIALREAVQERQRVEARARLGVDAGRRVVGTVARLDAVKNIPGLIDAVAQVRAHLPDVVLVVVGDGPEQPGIAAHVRRAGGDDWVRLLGHRDDARDLMAGFDVYANTSTSEGISLTILEAMASGLVVVATRVGGTPEVVVDGQSGRLVESGDTAGFAQAIQQVLESPSRLAYGLAGRQRVLTHFSLDHMVERYAAIYDA